MPSDTRRSPDVIATSVVVPDVSTSRIATASVGSTARLLPDASGLPAAFSAPSWTDARGLDSSSEPELRQSACGGDASGDGAAADARTPRCGPGSAADRQSPPPETSA